LIKIRVGDIRLTDEEKKQINEVVESGRLSEGPKVREFESLWSKFIGTKHCTVVNSGTSALIAGVYVLLYDQRFPKIKKGSKVITSPVTYIATSSALALAGLEPVYVDIDPKTFTLDVNQIEELLAKGDPEEYSMILPVHLMGYVNDMDAINELAKKYDLVVFEDAAQAHGSIYKGRKAGSLSLLADYSFYIAHNIQVGEMGAVVTSDRLIQENLKRIKANGRVCACPVCTRSKGICPYSDQEFDPRFTHDFIGFNFKLNEFQAAIGIPQVKRVEEIIAKRQANVEYLNSKLSKFESELQLPVFSKDVSYIAYPIVIKDNAINREELMRKLEDKGIENRPLFGCIPTQQPAFSYLKSKYTGKLPNADYVGKNGLYIGCHQYLSQADLDLIVEVFEQVLS
jgi:dTDP-4-amino-4,6-dideoxygalactose transaminase